MCRLMMTLLAPMISSRRKGRSPILVVAPALLAPGRVLPLDQTQRHAEGVLSARRVDRLRALPDQKLADAEEHRCPLGFFTLHGHETHRRPLHSLANRLGIRRIILLALD